MKLSTVCTCALVAAVCLFQSTAAEGQSSIHVRVHVEQPADPRICYIQCESGKYCPLGANKCEPPPANQCFNPATSLFVPSCAPGFKCDNGKCVYK